MAELSNSDMALGLALAVAALPIEDMLGDLYETEAGFGTRRPGNLPRAKVLRALLEVKRVMQSLETQL